MSTNKKVTLKDLSNGAEYRFNSLADASRFLGMNHGFLSNRLKRGKGVDGYEVELV